MKLLGSTKKMLIKIIPNKQFGQLITISPHSLTMLKTTNAEFQSIQVWFTDQTNKPLEIKDSVNVTLIIGYTLQKIKYSAEPKYRKYVKGNGVFFHSQEDLVINIVKN